MKLSNKGEPSECIGSVLFREEECYIATSRINEWMEKYLLVEINKFFGISFKEFMEQPAWQMDMMIESANKKLTLQSAQVDDIESSLKDMK